MNDLRVKLTYDHTIYHPSLKVGAEGVTGPPSDVLSKCSNEWTSVKFPGLEIELRWRHLDIVDPRWIDAEEQKRRAREKAIRDLDVTGVELIGPRGGFRELVLRYQDGKIERIRDRKEGQRLMDLLDECGAKATQKRDA